MLEALNCVLEEEIRGSNMNLQKKRTWPWRCCTMWLRTQFFFPDRLQLEKRHLSGQLGDAEMRRQKSDKWHEETRRRRRFSGKYQALMDSTGHRGDRQPPECRRLVSPVFHHHHYRHRHHHQVRSKHNYRPGFCWCRFFRSFITSQQWRVDMFTSISEINIKHNEVKRRRCSGSHQP